LKGSINRDIYIRHKAYVRSENMTEKIVNCKNSEEYFFISEGKLSVKASLDLCGKLKFEIKAN